MKLKGKICTYENPDIICLTETHLSGNNEISLEGYKFFGNNRKITKKRGVKTYGGVGILVKNTVFEEYSVSVVARDYEGLIAIRLTHKISGFESILSSTYLAPAESPYGADVSGFFNRLLVLIYENSESDVILFCGNVNVRIGTRKDVVINVDVKDRDCVDTVVNSHGRSFLEFLNDACCCVVNGRCGKSAEFTLLTAKV